MPVPKINLLFISSVLEEWDTRYENWDDAASVFVVVVVVVVVAIGVHFELLHTNRRLLRLKIGIYWSDTEKKFTTLGILIRKDFFIYPMKTLNTWFNNRFNKSSLLMQCNKNVFPVLMAQWIREFWSNEEKHNHSVLWCKKYHLISFPLFICRLNCIHLFRFRGTSGIDIALDKVDIDQCPQPDNAKEPNVFAGSARCKPETTKVTVVNKRQN